MAMLTLQQLYLGDNCNNMIKVYKDFGSNRLQHIGECCGLELLIRKGSNVAMEKLKNQGDCIADFISVL